MATQAIPFLTPEQYLEIERTAEFRSEYLNGELFAVSGASRRHSEIVHNFAAIFRAQARRRCHYFTTDMRLLTPPTKLYTYPDVMVVCGRIEYSGDREDMVTNPSVIAEVLSASTPDYDRGRKFVHYRSLPSLKDYLIVAQNSVSIEHHTRHADGSWLLRECSRPEEVISLASISVEVRLSDVYEYIEFGTVQPTN